MRLRSLVLLGCMACGAAGFARAGLIAVNFADAEFPSPTDPTFPVQTSLPFLLGSSDETPTTVLFLRYKIPDIADVVAINSMVVNVTLYDDEPDAGETAAIEFALPSQNLSLLTIPKGPIDGTTAGHPLALSVSLTPAQIGQVYPNLTDGVFRIRVVRNSGDFIVGGGSVSIDATLAPEPGSSTAMLGGLCGVAALIRAKKQPRPR